MDRSIDTAGVVTAGFFVIWAIIVFLTGLWCGRLPSGAAMIPQGQPEGIAATPTITIEGFRFLHAPAATKTWPEWVLQSDEARIYEHRREALVTNIIVIFSPERGTTTAVLMGQQGQLNLDSMDFIVDGVTQPLTIDWQGRYRLLTSTLTWRNAERVMETSTAVTIDGEGVRVAGTGMRWSLTEGTVTVLERVTATLGVAR